jgi:hypothetical protein
MILNFFLKKGCYTTIFDAATGKTMTIPRHHIFRQISKLFKFFFLILIFYINSIREVFCKFSGKNVANFTLHHEYAGNEVFILSTRGNKFRFNVYARYELLA